MDEKGHLEAGETGEPKVSPPALQTEQYAELLQPKEVEKTVLPTRMKKEDISEVPLKVPRFQYVDFPSLHQCIQQLTVPPLDTWLESRTIERPPICTPVTERVPRFKYVDYPSLHHCIKQLCVPPLESWSSGVAKPGTRCQEREGHGSISQPACGKDSQVEPEGYSASARKQDAYTAFPFPSPSPDPMQCVTTSSKTPHKPQYVVHSRSAPPVRSLRKRGEPHNVVVVSENPSHRSTAHPSPFARVKHCKVNVHCQGGRKSDNDVDKGHSESRFLQTQLQAQAESRDTPGKGLELWRAVPELVCQFCQKMFADPEALRNHQRSHREKVGLCNENDVSHKLWSGIKH